MDDELAFDQDAMTAAADLVGRTGAVSLDVGYLHDDVPADQAGWYATATYQGAKVIVEDRPGPVEALEGLARRLLSGAACRYCGRKIALSDARATGRCRWSRHADRWDRGCVATHPVPVLPRPDFARPEQQR